MNRSIIRLACLLPIAAFAGCEVGPDYHTPKVTMTDEWGELGYQPTTMPTTNPSSKIVMRPPPMIEWWTTFNDPELDALIRKGVAANVDLARATIHIRQAREARNYAIAGLFPSANVDASYEHTRASKNGVISAFSSGSGSGGSTNAGGGVGSNGGSAASGSSLQEFDLYQAGFDATWELDIWGRQRRTIEAADAVIDALVDVRRSTMLSLLGEVARNYVELRETQTRLQIARDNLDVEAQSFKLAQDQYNRGVTNELDVDRAQAQIASTRAEIPTLESQEASSVHELSILLDERPTDLADELRTAAPLPDLPMEVPVGLPSDLLRRRPDIRRAERTLAASTAGIGIAEAQLFPSFSLTGSFGTQALQPKPLLDFASRYYSIGPSVSWPLFDAGKIRDQIHIAKDQQLDALLAYRQAILSALKDVEDALVSYSKAQERMRSLFEAVVANRKSVRIANDLYGRGLTDFTTVIDAERSLLESQDQLAQAQGDARTQLVTLYKALGGGWEIDEVNRATADVPVSDDAEPKRSPL